MIWRFIFQMVNAGRNAGRITLKFSRHSACIEDAGDTSVRELVVVENSGLAAGYLSGLCNEAGSPTLKRVFATAALRPGPQTPYCRTTDMPAGNGSIICSI